MTPGALSDDAAARAAGSPAQALPLRYGNEGNPAALACIPGSARRVLDVGCGAGDNARLLQARGHEVSGITVSASEAAAAQPFCERVWVGDVERMELPALEPDERFDVALLSHVLEHLGDPHAALRRLATLLRPGGLLVVAVPNMAFWRVRLRVLRGDWSREDVGFFDRTHRQFWTYAARAEILQGTPFELVEAHGADGGVPLRPVRRAWPGLAAAIDRIGGAALPNLVAAQVVVVARRTG
jgi:2-polyprenyl-3-methyl-5-hydroxy-6-metoxy-1,4-benzoquinol methylase